MHNSELFIRIYPNLDAYEMEHRRTAEMDIQIIKKYSEGKSAVQIAMKVPCGEATVYRARGRVRKFLREINKPCKIVYCPSLYGQHKKALCRKY